MNILRALAAAAAIAALPQLANAAQIWPIERTDDVHHIVNVDIALRGDIEPGDGQRFIDMVSAYHGRSGYQLRTVQLDSSGGRLGEAATIGYAISIGSLSTTVPPGGQCSSACILPLFAGNRHAVAPTAKIGVHRASDNGVETSEALADTLRMAADLLGYGAPEDVVRKLLATPPDQTEWLGCLEVTCTLPTG